MNCELVYNYLFVIVSDIERTIADILRKYVPHNLVLEQFEKSDKTFLNDIAMRYKASVSTNNDTDIFQHMYLSSLGVCMKYNVDRLPETLQLLDKFRTKFSGGNVYSEIRNKIMHPVRPILSDEQSINQIDTLFTDYEEMQEIWSTH